MGKMFFISLTEQQVELLCGILEDEFQQVCVSYRLAKELKLEKRVLSSFRVISDLTCLMDELELQISKLNEKK